MARGTIKWFNSDRGYGFLTQDSGGDDVFVHQSVIDAGGLHGLDEGQQVEFDISQGPKGLQATALRVV